MRINITSLACLLAVLACSEAASISIGSSGGALSKEQTRLINFDGFASEAQSNSNRLKSLLTDINIDPNDIGTSSTGPSSRIANGDFAENGQFPYLAYIKINDSNKWTACGGTLIAPRVVLTAAHCIFNSSTSVRSTKIYVTIGASDVRRASTVHTLASVACPRAYSPVNLTARYGDIALLRLRQPSMESKIALAASTKYFNTSDSFVIAGWGYTARLAAISPKLKWAIVPGIKQKAFNLWAKSYAKALGVKQPMKMEKDHVAAGLSKVKADACDGDSGGPMILGGPRYGGRVPQDIQVGIISYGLSANCGTTPAIGFYTKIGYWRRWIEDTMSLNNWRGYAPPTRQVSGVEYNICFTGGDGLKSRTAWSASFCVEMCRQQGQCTAWSWSAVKPRLCHLKTSSTPDWKELGGNCISGLMNNVTVPVNSVPPPSTSPPPLSPV